ncbi:flagellar M-ring protein FliF [Conyzicola lurida]|uniref:Flagellar M-ring protein n=1 Tax=Conyzicola lurida TaxID=1172621 RepID=A0A841AUR7_9MICO|nr:flagellar basal-body MS-ring/collar protein FliF [Conyzicola lurida]MBB5845159.1 flagellar M-ring protein FliF [Conyzicola lurida]
MPRQVTSAFGRFADAIREFTIAQRTVALIGVAVLVLGIVALGFWITKPSYTPLFSGLSGADANTLVEQLRADGVPYELANGGATIMVPEENVYDERLKAAAAGLPSSSTGGYSLLDSMGVTASEFQQNVTYKRALEGELAKTISALTGVQNASVRLAIPEETVFVSETNDPTASVFVETQNGVSLSSDQVQAIVHLTSASIDGMAPEDVAVIDSKGTVLSAVGEGAVGGADQQMSDYETAIRASVQTMLDKVVGTGNATVVVAADMSRESGERVEETFSSPDGTLALSESATVEGGDVAGDTAAGVLGPDNIAVPAEGAEAEATGSSSIVRNNAVNKVTESTTIPAGVLTRKTISVALNQATATGLNVEDITALVSSAAGIDEERGDVVTVEVVPFNGAGAEEAAQALEAAAAAADADRMADLIRTGVIALAIALPVIIAIAVFAARSRRRKQDIEEAADLADLRSILNDTQPEVMATPLRPAIPTVPASPLLIEPNIDRTRAEIDALAAQDPQRAAEFLRGLMDSKQNA